MKEKASLREYLYKMLKKGYICVSKSPCLSPLLFVKKKGGNLCPCVNYQDLNSITVKNRYPIPNAKDLSDQLSGANIFSKVDLRDAFNQIWIRPGNKWKTAFKTRQGLFEYLVMPFGLCNAPSTF